MQNFAIGYPIVQCNVSCNNGNGDNVCRISGKSLNTVIQCNLIVETMVMAPMFEKIWYQKH